MSEKNTRRLGSVARKLNVGKDTIIDFLASKGIEIYQTTNAKITEEHYSLLAKEFAESLNDKEESESIVIGVQYVDDLVIDSKVEAKSSKKNKDEDKILIKNLSATKIERTNRFITKEKENDPAKKSKIEVIKATAKKLGGLKVVNKVAPKKEKEKTPIATQEKTPTATQEKVVVEQKNKLIKATAEKLEGLKIVDKIELPKEVEKEKKTPIASSDISKKKRPRKRIGNKITAPKNTNDFKKTSTNTGKNKSKRIVKEDPTDKEIQEQIKTTLARLSQGGRKKGVTAKYRKEKRSAAQDAKESQMMEEYESSQTLQVAEFISANDLASLMKVSVNDIISTCMNLGMFVSINQRLDAEAITIIADEFNFDVKFTSAEDKIPINLHQDIKKELKERPPIVTIMGHVDHGKTSLLDYIRQSRIIASEAGGITQHIGAYNITTKSGQKITFLDTPGHEAFTAMRARGTKITDIVIIVIAADDNVMPQTKEAINHAQVAGVPIIIAINKMDSPNANADKIKEELSQINILVESWSGKYQDQEISAKTGDGIEALLEKVLLESEILELKANPNKNASGSVIEAALDKGRGYVTTIMVQEGTLKIGDILLAGSNFGKVKAIFDHNGAKVKEAGPSTPIQVLGLDGAPQAGDAFNIIDSDKEAREIANKREQILREQNIRSKKHITLDEIGRRLAIGNFKELNIIIKGDVDGSIEALSDSLQKLTTEEVQVNIIHKAIGQISESDVSLATASDAIILGFQVRPSSTAKKNAEKESVEIRLYSIIYDAINDIKDAMEGMLDPDTEEVIVGNVEIRETFQISKIGTIAGCMVTDGYIKRSNPIRLIRDGIVVYEGKMGQLKRFKDNVQEVKNGYECGLSIKNFNDINVKDIVESYEKREVKRKL